MTCSRTCCRRPGDTGRHQLSESKQCNSHPATGLEHPQCRYCVVRGLSVHENLFVSVGFIDFPKGGNPRKLPITFFSDPKIAWKENFHFFHVQNDNNLCLAISIGLCFLKTCET